MNQETLKALLTAPWWTFDPATAGVWDHIYRGFNLFEGLAWVLFAVLVFVRYLRRGQSKLEIVYAVIFLLFGLTDFREAYVF